LFILIFSFCPPLSVSFLPFLSLSFNICIFPLVLSFPLPTVRPALWSSGQSSWLQVRRPGFDSRHYQKKM
jgi:hypothetical protein